MAAKSKGRQKNARSKRQKSGEAQTFFRTVKRLLSGLAGAVLALAFCICLQAAGVLDADALPALKDLKLYWEETFSLPDASQETKPSPVSAPTNGTSAEVHIIDVGQGDSSLVLCGDSAVLLDGGERDQGERILSYLEQEGVDALDLVVASHPHSDHIGGLIEVLENIPVEEVVMPKLPDDQVPTTKVYENFLDAIETNGASVTPAVSGDTYSLDNGGVLQILGPAGTFDDLNDWSASAKFTFGSRSFLFSGDMEEAAEEALLQTTLDLSADVLTLCHHGSRYANTEAFLEAVSPEYAVAQVGADNDYGHPHEEAVARAKELGATLYRTDENGTIVFTTDGTSLEVTCER